MEQRVGVRSLFKMEQRVGVRSLFKMEQGVGVIRSLLQMKQQVGVRSLLFSRRDIRGYIWCPPNELGILFINIVCSPASMVIACGHSAFLH